MTLLFWQFFPLPLADYKEDFTAPKKVIVVESKKQELPSQYQGVKIDREGLRGLLKEQFTLYGIADQIPMAIKVIECESGFQIDPPHNNISWGVAQFTKSTWHDFGHDDIMNPLWQFQTMAKMFKMGLAKRWDCYRKMIVVE